MGYSIYRQKNDVHYHVVCINNALNAYFSKLTFDTYIVFTSASNKMQQQLSSVSLHV